MAPKKPRALGNDPFRRGAASREPVQDAHTQGEKLPNAVAAAAGRETPVEAHEAEAAARAAPVETSEAAVPALEPADTHTQGEMLPGALAAAEGRETPVDEGRGTRAPAKKPARKRSAGGAAAGAKGEGKRAPRRAPEPEPIELLGAEASVPAIDLEPIEKPTAAESPAAPKRRAPRRHDEAELSIAGDAGLLPSDLAAAPREPSVIAVAPIGTAAPTPPRQRAEAPERAGDAAAAALVAFRQLLGLPATAPSFDVDELGYDPNFEEQVRPFFDWIFDRWFRVQLHGLEKLPAEGPVILVANRAGALPWDSMMLSIACRRAGRVVRPLVEDDVFHLPSLGVLVNRLGAVRACPENAERILGAGGAIAVFPEGATGFGKPFRERYKLQRFGRGGFAKLALRTGARVVPVAIVGSEEVHPLLGKLPARPLGLPFLPLTPTFPWLGLAGLVPLPARWHIEVGEPFDLAGYGPGAASDDPLVLRLAEQVRGTIQAMLDARLAQRRSVFGG